MIGICSIRACESGLVLIIGMDGDLVITGLPIKETKERMVCKPFQHFINEGQREMILLRSLVEFSIVNTHPPSTRETLSDQLILVIRNNCHPSLFRHYLNRTNPLLTLTNDHFQVST